MSIKKKLALPKLKVDAKVIYHVQQKVMQEKFLQDIHATIVNGSDKLTSDFSKKVNFNKSGTYRVIVKTEKLGLHAAVNGIIKKETPTKQGSDQPGKPKVKPVYQADPPSAKKTTIKIAVPKQEAKQQPVSKTEKRRLPETGDGKTQRLLWGTLMVAAGLLLLISIQKANRVG